MFEEGNEESSEEGNTPSTSVDCKEEAMQGVRKAIQRVRKAIQWVPHWIARRRQCKE